MRHINAAKKLSPNYVPTLFNDVMNPVNGYKGVPPPLVAGPAKFLCIHNKIIKKQFRVSIINYSIVIAIGQAVSKFTNLYYAFNIS